MVGKSGILAVEEPVAVVEGREPPLEYPPSPVGKKPSSQ